MNVNVSRQRSDASACPMRRTSYRAAASVPTTVLRSR